MILKYDSFRNDLILESIINESILYFSDDIKNRLNSIDNDIAKALLELEKTDIKPDMTFISAGKDGYFSFTTMRNAKNKIKKDFGEFSLINKKAGDPFYIPNEDSQKDFLKNVAINFNEPFFFKIDDLDTKPMDKLGPYLSGKVDDFYGTSRNEVSIGRFVNRVFPGKFNSSEVESFVNSFKASVVKDNEEFKLVSGKDIIKWYNSDNYNEDDEGRIGNLWSSCMRYSECGNFFKIYSENPEVCQMLILIKGDKIFGRALIWKLDSISIDGLKEPIYFMDRQYTIKDSDAIKFKNHARERNWIWKSRNSHSALRRISSDSLDDVVAEMAVKVKAEDYEMYPYMDTFRLYNPKTGILKNIDEDMIDDENTSEFIGNYILHGADGDDYDIVKDTVWSEYHSDEISRNDAIWSGRYDSWIIKSDAVEVKRGYYTGWYPEDSHDVVYDMNGEAFHSDDVVWSELYSYYIFSEDARSIILEINGLGDVYDEDNYIEKNDKDYPYIELSAINELFWYKKINWEFGWDQYDCISKSLLTKASTINFESGLIRLEQFDYWVPELYSIDVYRVNGRIKNNYYDNVHEIIKEAINEGYLSYEPSLLTESDAIILGYELDKSEKIVSDEIIYWNENSLNCYLMNKLIDSTVLHYDNLINDADGRRKRTIDGYHSTIELLNDRKKKINKFIYLSEVFGVDDYEHDISYEFLNKIDEI